MTDDNSELVDIDENGPESLEAFEETFYEKPKDLEVDVTDTEEDTLATDEDTDASAETEDEDPEEEETEDEEDAPEPEVKPKGKKSNVQERINELTRQKHEAERRASEREAALIRRLEEVEARSRPSSQGRPQAHLPQGGPNPDAVNSDGEPVYPLGEYDPSFIRDLTEYTVEAKTAAIQQREQEARLHNEVARAQEELKNHWAEKVAATEEVIPEIREHIAELANAFQGIDPVYGEYLAMTIMSSDKGPEVMEYLSQNIGEAQKIVASGPAAATLALGRIEAQLGLQSSAPRATNNRVSRAPSPPVGATAGRKGQASVRPDTNNLDAFERLFYNK